MAPSGILATMPLMEVRDPKQVGQTFLSATSPRVGAFLPPERTRIGLDELPLVSFSNPRRGACRIVRGGRNAAHSRFAGRHECLPHQMPFNFPNNFLAPNGLYALAMARAFARFRDPRRRAIWWHRVEFYEKAWREAAQEVGASFTMLGSDIHQIALGEFCTRVTENTCAIDDPVTLAVVSDKPLTYRILATQSLPVARHAGFSFKNLKPALEFIAEIDGECVILSLIH